jgi:molybdopterin-containing oxidoreductase family iron-sulfur binding subunit
MNRLYVIESTPSITGAMADHRLRLPARAIEDAAFALAQRLTSSESAPARESGSDATARFLDALARDLLGHRGSSLVMAGDAQPARVHALAHLINTALATTVAPSTTPMSLKFGQQTICNRFAISPPIWNAVSWIC